MIFTEVPRLALAHTPTPLWRNDRLDALIGTEVWVKRDDMTAGPEAGNKIRKLEYLLAQALAEKADTVITCGAAQSNHARATALCCAQLGLNTHLLLRSVNGDQEKITGNLFLDTLCGATIHWVTPTEYAERQQRMQQLSESLQSEGRRVCIIPEGGSSPRGSLGYVRAMQEVSQQLQTKQPCGNKPLPATFDAVVHACGSGGTAAGVAVGAARFSVARQLHTIAVCDDQRYFQTLVRSLTSGIRQLAHDLPSSIDVVVHDQFIGPGYGHASEEQMRFISQVAQATGLVLDPVYSGKALFGLAHGLAKHQLAGKRVLFIHTGGLPGLLS